MPENELPVLPLRGAVLLPGPTLPIAVSRAPSLRAVEEALGENREIFVVTQQDATADASKENLSAMGVIAHVGAVQRDMHGTRILLTGQQRAVAVAYRNEEIAAEGEKSQGELLRARVMPVTSLNPTDLADSAFQALHKELRGRALEFGQQRGVNRETLVQLLDQVTEPGALADLVGSHLDLPSGERQAILETLGVEDRMRKVLVHLQRQIDLMRSQKMIQKQVSEELQGRQKEMYLREQLRAIQKELGDDSEDDEAAALRDKLAALELPEEAREEVQRELSRLERAGPQSNESQVIRTYLQWMAELPWDRRSEERLDLTHAQEVLERDHYGLGEVKDRVLEFLSVRKLQQAPESQTHESELVGSEELHATPTEPLAHETPRGPILLFTGPPGVGKTSVARSIARALGREYVRIALGGARDEADVRGHRRTYVGAMPGRIIQGLKRAGTKNPVVLLDELDKLGVSHQGDPASALLEVLDPAQNHAFGDHYLNVPFDLSEVLFIATANVTHAIPAPLLDRMEVVEFSGYTEREKLEIARRYLVPRQLEESGLTNVKPQPQIDDEALGLLISSYTRESGVRGLEKRVAAISRKLARSYASNEDEADPTVSASRVRKLLGRPRVHPEHVAEQPQVGMATGMYYTPAGGDIMFVEAALRRLSPATSAQPAAGTLGGISLILTGQLGDVMKESARAALTYATMHARQLTIPGGSLGPSEVHVHVPAGAIPKDGPSAGVTIATALISAMSGRPVRPDVAMSGEITLTGRVLPVGGIKEKVLGAERAGARLVILPRGNAADLEDLPTEVLERLQFRFADTLSDVLRVALVPEPASDRHSAPAARGQKPTGGNLDTEAESVEAPA